MSVIIPFIRTENIQDVPQNALSLPLSCKNWEKDYPTDTHASVILWHDSLNLYIGYKVEEKYVAATVEYDNGKVSKDSCVEAFISFDDSGYYNIEANCIGKILMSHRKSRKENVVYASQEILDKIDRFSSLGIEPFECRETVESWILTLKLPLEVFFKNKINNFSGLECKGNFYKCGDLLPDPHFLSWKPIDTPKPDFHRPEFFASLKFEC